jgi:hypothetical protein
MEYINPTLTCGTPPRLTTKIRSRHLQNPYLHEPSQHGRRTQGRRMKPGGNPSLGSIHPPARKREEALQERHHHQLGRVYRPPSWCTPWDQGCHKRRFWRKITIRTSFSSRRPRTSACVHVYPADAVLPADGFLPSANAVKTASART